mgnify:CR=1 FL=1
MGTKKVVIRTADLGGEKQAECLELGEDRNPEIGYRGIRVSLDKDEIFKTQLRAIFTCICIWKYVGHVSDDHGCGRSKTGETDSGKDKRMN